MSTDVEYMVKELNKLVGYKITGTAITEDKDGFGFVLEKLSSNVDGNFIAGNRKTAWIDCDAECNGPGWVSVQEFPYEKSSSAG